MAGGKSRKSGGVSKSLIQKLVRNRDKKNQPEKPEEKQDGLLNIPESTQRPQS